MRVAKAIRRSRQNSQGRPLTQFERIRIHMRYAAACYLTKATGIAYEVDHIQPISEGGLHHPDNLQILTAQANRKKWAS